MIFFKRKFQLKKSVLRDKDVTVLGKGGMLEQTIKPLLFLFACESSQSFVGSKHFCSPL